MIRWANGNDQEPAPQTKKASSSEEVRASALRLSSQMALSLRLQLRTTEFMLLLSIYYRRSMGDPLFETKEPLVGLTSLPCSDYGYLNDSIRGRTFMLSKTMATPLERLNLVHGYSRRTVTSKEWHRPTRNLNPRAEGGRSTPFQYIPGNRMPKPGLLLVSPGPLPNGVPGKGV